MVFGGGGVDDADDLQARVAEAARRHLRSELLNRISRVVVFNPLTREHVRAVAEKFIARLNTRLAEQASGSLSTSLFMRC